jgi:hypothetical protein
MKFLHTMGAVGLMGSIASLLVLMIFEPPPTSSLAGYALMRGAMAEIATWVFFPSLGLTLLAGLLAMLNPGFHNAGWAWAKLATGILVFEGGLVDTLGPLQEEAKRSAAALAGQLDAGEITGAYGAERSTLWVLLAVATVNVALGIWRPRFTRISE